MQTLARLEKTTDRIWGEFCEIYPLLIRHNPPDILLNSRYKRTIASCTPTENKIEMAARYLATNPVLMYTEILPHEIAHQIHYILEGEASWLNQKNHGKQWRKIMLDYGAEPKRAYQI